jgi:acyl-CoA synthetase (AMP-forming)/AMP-acid ligase II
METVQNATSVLQSCLLYGPFGYYENPLRRVALKINADVPSIITIDGALDKGKNTVWTQRNILNSANALVSSLELTAGDVVFVPGYNQSSFGVIANYAAFLAGATVVYPSREFDAEEVYNLLDNEKCSALFLRKANVDDLLALQNEVVAEKLKYIVTDQLTNDEVNNLKKRFPKVQIKQLGGLDEAAGLLTIDGQLVPGVEVKVTREKDDRIVHKDTYGDLRVRGNTISKKLWNDIGLMNADVDEEGWVRTGKMGKVDSNGNLTIQ